jgi:hypothetical protein
MKLPGCETRSKTVAAISVALCGMLSKILQVFYHQAYLPGLSVGIGYKGLPTAETSSSPIKGLGRIPVYVIEHRDDLNSPYHPSSPTRTRQVQWH